MKYLVIYLYNKYHSNIARREQDMRETLTPNRIMYIRVPYKQIEERDGIEIEMI